MRNITINHRVQGRAYLLTIEGVQETILISADDLLNITNWGIAHRAELEQEAKEEHNEISRKLLDQ